MDNIDFSKLKRCVSHFKNKTLEWKMCIINKSNVCDDPQIKELRLLSEVYPCAVWKCYDLSLLEIEQLKKKYSIG